MRAQVIKHVSYGYEEKMNKAIHLKHFSTGFCGGLLAWHSFLKPIYFQIVGIF